MSGVNQDQVRSQVQQVVTRIKSDKSYARQAQQDPVKTLTDAGLPEDAVSDMLNEDGWNTDEVTGFAAGRKPTVKCSFTCACTPCCLSGSCGITV